jgi:hypothetical protein
VLVAVAVAGCKNTDHPAADATPERVVTTPSAVVTPTTTPTPTPPPAPKPDLSTLSAAQILAKTQAAAKAATSVRMRGSATDGKTRTVFDLNIAQAGGSGSITADGAKVQLIVIGRTVYLRLSDAAIRQQAKSKAQAKAMIQLLGGRWIKTTLDDKDFGELAVFASKPAFFDGLFEATGTVRKTRPAPVNGVPSIGLKDSTGTLWVDRATGHPVRIESGSDALTFSDYNRAATPKAPPAAQVIDGDALKNV